jgi:hypothetical protein
VRGLVARVRDSMGDVSPRSDLALLVGVVLALVMIAVVLVAVTVAVVQLVS